MKITKLEEAGYWSAMRGVSLNKQQPIENMPKVALKLCNSKRGSDRKFLRQIFVSLLIENAPRYWWTEFDTYKVGTVRNSGSTMHNIHKRPFEEDDFKEKLSPAMLAELNSLWGDFISGSISISKLKAYIPEGYLQSAVVTLNYEVLRTIILDRFAHKLPEWRLFIDSVLKQLQHPDLIDGVDHGKRGGLK